MLAARTGSRLPVAKKHNEGMNKASAAIMTISMMNVDSRSSTLTCGLLIKYDVFHLQHRAADKESAFGNAFQPIHGSLSLSL